MHCRKRGWTTNIVEPLPALAVPNGKLYNVGSPAIIGHRGGGRLPQFVGIILPIHAGANNQH
jgi:hypothetical protein